MSRLGWQDTIRTAVQGGGVEGQDGGVAGQGNRDRVKGVAGQGDRIRVAGLKEVAGQLVWPEGVARQGWRHLTIRVGVSVLPGPAWWVGAWFDFRVMWSCNSRVLWLASPAS